MFFKRRNSSFVILLIICLAVIFYQVESSGIPYFARKYKTSCSTCHEAITKRNTFGEIFRRNGYLLPVDDEKFVKEKPVKLGAEEWKEMWPEAIWPGLLPESFPIAAATLMRANYDAQEINKGNRFEFNMPQFFNLFFGGSFGQDISFFGEWSAYSSGVNARGLQRLFVQFNDVVGTENLFNIRVGRFEPGITDNYIGTQKLTSGYPLTIDYDPGGGWRPRDPQSGIELNGIYNHYVYYAAGVVNGESKTTADPGDQKDVYARLAYQFGGDGFDGRGLESDSGSVTTSENYVNVGANAYWGSRLQIPSGNVNYDNYFNRFSCDIKVHVLDFDILGGFISGKDENPDNDLRILQSSAYFLEGNYNFYPWLIGTLRVEKAEAWKSNEDRDNFINIIPNLVMLYRANVRFSIESMIRINGDKDVNGTIIPGSNNEPFQFVALSLLFAF